jgi:septum formation protein
VTEKAIRDGDVTPDLVIGADTIVDLDGMVLEKPDGAADARSMLSRLSGCSHQVHTGVVLVLPRAVDPATGKSPLVRVAWFLAISATTAGGTEYPFPMQVLSFAESTSVHFETLSPATIDAYVASGEPFDKAGAYGIQGVGGSFVSRIDGCYFSVVGFPVHRFCKEVVRLIENGTLPLEGVSPPSA